MRSRWLSFGGAMTSNMAAASRGVLAKVRSGLSGSVLDVYIASMIL